MGQRLLACLVLAGICAAGSARGDEPTREARVVDFGRDVRPVLARACTSCHGPDRQRGGLRLDRKAPALRGGDLGPAIVPGRGEESLLIERVISTDPAERMPQKGDPLTAAEVDVLRAWIDGGATWPDGLDVVRSEGGPGWWSLRPVRRAPIPLPSGEDRQWARNAVDAFVLARLRAQGLSPSPEADRRTLIRRLSLDLIGLPPTPEEVDAFVADRGPLAYEDLVERLLASPRHGERWAQHWLDVIRYGDTHGFEVNTPRPNAWPFRDWVIRSLNVDKPYTEFVTEQLAGDASDEDAATGFLVAGPALLPGQVGRDEASMRQARQDELHETVSTTSSTFLGLTAGCARCHSHKFDPIPQTDYYALQAVFAGLRYGERPLRTGDQEARSRERALVAAELSRAQLALDEHEPLAAGPADGPPRREAVRPGRNVERFAPVEARMVRFVIDRTNDGIEPCVDELEVFSAGSSPRNVALTSAGATSRASSTYPNSDIHRLAHLCDGRYGNGRSWISRESGKGWVQVDLPEASRIDRVVWGRDREGRYVDRLAVSYRVEVATEPGRWQVVASSADRLPYGAKGQEADAPSADPSRREARVALRRRAEELGRRLAALSAEPMVFAGSFRPPSGPTFRLHRGDPMQPREAVAPDAFSALREALGPLELPDGAPEQARRSALARWITDPRNPLTPRVMVNRLWQYHFGTGLVDTPSDFGRNGTRPTHPELLDHLALAFVESGWSLKAMHRLIVLSATYRQADKPRPDALRVDAQSRLLWRFPPRRLEAEAIRDSIVQASGVIDWRMGGPGFLAFKPNENYVRVYDPKETWDPQDWRRMVYMHKVRMAQDSVFGVFDCPDAGQPAPRRGRSTTALQALSLFNSTFVAQQAELFGRRVAAESGPDPAAQVARAFRLALGRPPSGDEGEACSQVVREHGLAALGRVLFNTNEFLFLP